MPMLRLTYAELAERTGHNAEAARALARRRRWRIERGNDGKARVLVEEDELAVRPPGQPAGRDRADGRVAQLEAERDRLQVELLDVTARAARAEGEAAALRDALADLSGRLDRATDELRDLRRPWWRRLLG